MSQADHVTDHQLGGDLDSRAVAHQLGVSLRTLHRWRTSGRLAYYQTPGGAYRYKRTDVERLRSPTTKPTARAQDIEAHIMAQRDASAFRDRLLGCKSGSRRARQRSPRPDRSGL